MGFTGKFRKQAAYPESKAEKKSLIENTDMMLTDEDLRSVSGGTCTDDNIPELIIYRCKCGTVFAVPFKSPCPSCGETDVSEL